MSQTPIPTIVYAEMTPNPATMKFVADRAIVNGDYIAEYLHWTDVKDTSPLAEKLYTFPFVKSLFFAGNFVTVTKIDDIAWDYVTMELREFILDFLKQNQWAVTKQPEERKEETTGEVIKAEHATPSTDTEFKIIELLDEYVKPAVENDGGAIHFKSFENGKVHLSLRGACSGCPSSKMTLKGGIETLLKQHLPEVQEVVAEEL
ncbi:MAG TPA: NifU family protein [Flavobacteriales bacterium]|nr:NifU family protein [Flavobacteriales bacterium]